MEFHEKMQELRKSRSLTQEELAKEIFVSRTAISKWESGRGYPSIDSLKELSRFFSVTVDELIRPEEMLTAAEEEKRTLVGSWLSLVCGALDLLTGILLILPAFGNGGTPPETAPLFALTGVRPWVKAVFLAGICLTALNGLCGLLPPVRERGEWSRRLRIAGMALSVVCVTVFLAARQPYAGIFCFALLVIKGVLLLRAEQSFGRR